MSPLDVDVKSPTDSVESDLLVTPDMLDDQQQHHYQQQQQQHQQQQQILCSVNKRKRQLQNDDQETDLNLRKLPLLAGNNNDVSFVLEEHSHGEQRLHDDADDVSSPNRLV
ncbi:hypothetical protein TKK_0015154 [Trichogramma kaykai]